MYKQVVERPRPQRHTAREMEVHRREEVAQLRGGLQPWRAAKTHIWKLRAANREQVKG